MGAGRGVRPESGSDRSIGPGWAIMRFLRIARGMPEHANGT